MSRFDDQELPHELREVGQRLRDARPSFTDLELDNLKRLSMNRSGSRRTRPSGMRGNSMRHRAIAVLTSVLLVGGAAGAALAAVSGGTTVAKEYCNKGGNNCSPTLSLSGLAYVSTTETLTGTVTSNDHTDRIAVQVFSGTTLVKQVSGVPNGSGQYSFTITGLAPGTYNIVAVQYDSTSFGPDYNGYVTDTGVTLS